MANKRKGLAGAMSESKLVATLRDSAQQIWLAGLGAHATAQVQGSKVFDALAKEGAAIQSLAQKAVAGRMRAAAVKAEAARRKLEKVLEASVMRSLKRIGVPSSKDIDALSRRVIALNALVRKITAGGERGGLRRSASQAAVASAAPPSATRRKAARPGRTTASGPAPATARCMVSERE